MKRIPLRRIVLSLLLTGGGALLGGASPHAREPAAPEAPETLAVEAGLGYYAILPNKLLLASAVSGAGAEDARVSWTQVSGPSEAVLERPGAAVTWASAGEPGVYLFRVRAETANASAEAETTVRVYPPGEWTGNPILPGMFPDPHVLFDDGTFYIYATSMENEKGAYGRGAVWSSKDFVNWEMRLTNWPEYGKFGGDIWAPDIVKKDGRFYLFVTKSGSYDTWIGVADRPEGPWRNLREDDTPIVGGGGNAGRIVPAYNMDAQPFIDDDGEVYMYWGWAEAMAARLTPDLKEIDGPVHFLKGTKWLPDGGTLPQRLQVDLGETTPVSRVETSPEFRHVVYQYRIDVSEDGENWTVFADRTGNTGQKAGEGYVDEGDAAGRYVRITFTGCEGNWAGLYDFRVFSDGRLVSRDRPTTASSMRGPGTEPANAVDGSDGPYLTDFVEGSYMIKRNGTYYLLYSSGALHDGSYSVHYAMGDGPFGPFVMPEQNVVLQSNAAGTTLGPGHNSVLEFEGAHYIVYHQHNQPHVGANGVFRQTCADKLAFNDDGTIRPVVPTQTGVGPLRPAAAPGRDLARGRYAEATSSESAFHLPEYALDHNFASLWRAADATMPQSLTVDLGDVFDVARVETSFEYPTLGYKYVIETSLDGKAWETFADHAAEFPETVSPRRDAGAARAAFVRITITECLRPENKAGVYSLRVFGD